MADVVYKPPTQAKYSGTAAQQVQPVVQRKSYLYSGTRGAPGTTTLYTVPAGKIARLCYWQVLSQVNTFTYLLINSDTLLLLYPLVQEYSTLFLGYDSAPILRAGETVKITIAAGGVGDLYASIIITEEELSSYA